ncbi:MAG: hypothetical protein JXB45_00725 [Candidatus Krumholzibacteriota bacterium]|nr:hypothetical protein [Candidatus Krumholzibacteriota bacterium]
MKRIYFILTLLSFLTLVLAGCSTEEQIFRTEAPEENLPTLTSTAGTSQSSIPTTAMLHGYLVEFTGRDYNGEATTFYYTVTGAGAEHDLLSFFIELGDCVPYPADWEPSGVYVNIHSAIDLYGIKWYNDLGMDESRDYSVTFSGDIPLGITRTCIMLPYDPAVAQIAGPGCGYEISGNVYIDADGDGVRDIAEESGIAGVTVTLSDGDGHSQTALTDLGGDYEFLANAGTYTLLIEAATPAEDFNESLAESFDPSGPTSVTVSIGPDSPGNDFGFSPQVEEITADLEEGIILTTGEPAKFWTKEVRSALHGGNGNPTYDVETMAQFLVQIQALFLPEPFQFTPGNEFQEALNILKEKAARDQGHNALNAISKKGALPDLLKSMSKKDPLLILLKELLTAEFNHVSGRGMVEDPELQNVMLAWAEAIAAEALASTENSEMIQSSRDILKSNGPLNTRIDKAIEFLEELNGAIGGGSGGGG